jgi:hypothetical protein
VKAVAVLTDPVFDRHDERLRGVRVHRAGTTQAFRGASGSGTQAFYKAMEKDGLPAAAALRQAQIQMLV